MYKHSLLYADPHPGNYRFLGGARVAFLDFGCVKALPLDLVKGMKRYVIAAQDEDWEAFYDACVEVLGYDRSDEESFKVYTDYTNFLPDPLPQEGPLMLPPERAREAVAFLFRSGKKLVFRPDDTLPNLPKPIRMPNDFTFVNRLQWGLSSVMGGLRAEAD